jgi:hypothetical protein
MKCLFVQSNEGKTGLKCVRRGWLNYPPSPMAVPEMAGEPPPPNLMSMASLVTPRCR